MDRPRISFCLFAYKQERFIREAVASVFSQTYSPMEIILSDDCSPDGTFKIMQAMVESYRGPHKIILNRNETNLGPSKHINKVAKLASGDWLVVMAGDDISYPERTQQLMEKGLKNPNVYAILSGWDVIDENGNLKKKRQNNFGRGEVTSINFCSIDPCLKILGAVAAWRRELFEIFEPLKDNVVREDVVFGFRALLCGSIVVLPDVLVQYRQHGNNVSAGPNLDRCGTYERIVKIEEKTAQWLGLLNNAIVQMQRDVAVACLKVRRLPLAEYEALTRSLTLQLNVTSLKSTWWQLCWRQRFQLMAHYLLISDRRKPVVFWMMTRLFGLSFFAGVHGALFAFKHLIFGHLRTPICDGERNV